MTDLKKDYEEMILGVSHLLNDTGKNGTGNLGLSSEYHTERIYLLILDLLVFCFITYLSHSSYKKFSSQKSSGSSDEVSNHQYRVNFIKGLFLANGSKI